MHRTNVLEQRCQHLIHKNWQFHHPFAVTALSLPVININQVHS